MAHVQYLLAVNFQVMDAIAAEICARTTKRHVDGVSMSNLIIVEMLI
jgi:hypothetical protein